MIGTLSYHRPSSLDEAAQILAAGDADAAVLGGGTMLTPMLVRRELRVRDVVDLRDLDLGGIDVTGDEARIGARATYADVLGSAELARAVPLLPRMAEGITGGAQIRNQGTLGGSACFANPSSDVPACLVALGARLRLHGSSGPRTVDATEFFVGAFETARRPDELLVDIAFAVPSATFGYAKLKISESSWPIATAIAAREPGGGAAWLTLGAVHRRPVRLDVAAGAEEGLDVLVRGALDDPWSDVLAPGEYRRDVAGAIARRAWAEMVDNEREQGR
jgi:CO/xanthine dehydrogenase FAD-binding subunit